MRKLLAVIGLAVLTHASAQGVMVSSVSPSDLAMLFDDLRAMEITIPAGTQSYSVSHGDSSIHRTMYSSALRGSPTRLRIVAGFPAGLEQAKCAENSMRTATLLAQFHGTQGPGASSGTPHHRQHACLPRPERLAGEHWLVLEHPQAPQLDEWTPVYVYATSEDSTDSDGNYPSRLTPPRNLVLGAGALQERHRHGRNGKPATTRGSPAHPPRSQGSQATTRGVRRAGRRAGRLKTVGPKHLENLTPCCERGEETSSPALAQTGCCHVMPSAAFTLHPVTTHVTLAL
jgi:hypothetical protein